MEQAFFYDFNNVWNNFLWDRTTNCHSLAKTTSYLIYIKLTTRRQVKSPRH